MNENVKEDFKKVYQIFSANKDEMTDMRESLREQVKALSKIMEIKPSIINKSFNSLYRIKKTGIDEISLVNDLLHDMGKEDVIEE